MKVVTWIDANGRKHRSLVRNDDPDDAAIYGLPDDPPSVDELDWEAIKTELHNALIDRGIITWKDVVGQQTAIGSITQSLLRKRLVELYKRSRDQ